MKSAQEDDHPKDEAVQVETGGRRWFHFRLSTLLILLAISGPVIWVVYDRWFRDIYANVDYDKFVGVGAIDPSQSSHVTELLDSHRIPNLVEGSVVYGIAVPPENAEQAKEILTKDSKKVGYQLFMN